MRKALVLGLLAALVLIVSGASSSASQSSPAQALRTCVDRWNQDNMLGWGPTLASVSIRGLTAEERSRWVIPNPTRPRCTVSVADYWPRALRHGCSGGTAMPGYPGACFDRRSTWVCVINVVGSYDCLIR